MITEEDVKKRNSYVENLFRYINKFTYEDFKVIGDINKPAIVINETYCLSCFIKNFYIVFMSESKNGEKLFSLNLKQTYNLDKSDIDCIIDWIQNANHRRINKIKIKNTQLYLTGYQKVKNILYPVFCEKNPKLYFQKPTEIVENYKHLNLEIE